MPLAQRVDFWIQLRTSVEQALRQYPGANLILAGDCNVYLRELMGAERERSCEPRIRELVRALCQDFCLNISNPPGVSTHRSGSCIDVVLTSHALCIENFLVHDGDTCGCQQDSCHPAVGSDHKLITFRIAVSDAPTPSTQQPWPTVRNWHPVIRSLRPALLQWASKLLRLRQRQSPPLLERRAALDVLYAEFVVLVWQGPEPFTTGYRRGNHRPQPDWWDDECYDQMVSRNAAWRRWRRERTPSAFDTFRQKRLQFHHVVRRKKAGLWSSWLCSQERLSRSNPRLAAHNVRAQLGADQRTLPRSMRCPASGRRVEGSDCLDAWRAHFRDVPVAAQPEPAVQCSPPPVSEALDITSRVAALRRDMPSTLGQLDFPFTEAELQNVLSQLPLHRAAGPDGLPYDVFVVDDDCLRAALLTFFELVRHWTVVPSIWRSARVRPLHKSGPVDEFNNYRPISLLCCSLKIFERLLLARVLPQVDPQLDESQAGFRWGAEEQIYTLVETLRLRAGRRTFCAFVDVRKAFDVAWRDAVLLKLTEFGICGALWSVIADLLSDTSARVIVNGSISASWPESAGVRQGSVLGPLLFNILFNSIADAIRTVCPGVSLSTDRSAPVASRVALLLYADDLVVLAEDAAQLQRALDAIGAWGSQWRFSFGIGPEKSAVMVVGSRSTDFRFVLQGSLLPCVRQYTYLGVTFEASRKWHKHAARLLDAGNRRFHQFLGWAENRQLHTGFRGQLFQTYVLPAIVYGAHFLDSGQVARLDQKLRQWGRRLLHWPGGAPSAAVLGELGWLPFLFEMQRLQFGLFGRLATADALGARRSLAARVFNFALQQPGSWAHSVSQTMRDSGIPLPRSCGLLPGAGARQVAHWSRHAVRPVLLQRAHAQYRGELMALPSLADYAVYQPLLHSGNNIHFSRLPSSLLREWTLARCGHHPFQDGRIARHAQRDASDCLCGAPTCTLLHAIRECPLFDTQRHTWVERLSLRRVPLFGDAELLRWIFDPHPVPNNHSAVNAHVHYVASICQIARSLHEGLQMR